MQGLSLETIPPVHFPFRFFLTAPWMGVLAAVALLAGDSGALGDQWRPELLAVTHLLTLGFMGMVMLGAMFQLVPVISGRLIPGGWPVVSLVHILLLAGVMLLSLGFSTQAYRLFFWAGPALLLAFTIFLAALGVLLSRRVGGGDSIFCIRFSALSLLVTVAIGLLRSAGYAGLAVPLVLDNALNLHLAWGLGGWTLLLVMGASYQVIPMFHVTPSYPTVLARALPVVVFLSLLALTLINLGPARAVAVTCLGSAAIVYAVFSIRLLNRRKRKVPDITARFWRLSLACLGLAGLLLIGVYFAGESIPSANLRHRLPVSIGLLMIYGFAVSVIMGMLQKIVPFLCYLHLQRRCMAHFELLKTLPHMGEIIPAYRSRWQFRIHVTALLALLLAMAVGDFAGLAALVVAADFLWLGYTLSSATWLYHRTNTRVAGVVDSV
jgi:hypothetical protein